MRKLQKKNLQDIVVTLIEANEEIRGLIEKGKNDIALDLLAQCQETAIKVGTLIEEEKGEGFVTVGIIEKYCELVYFLYEKLVNGDEHLINDDYKQLREQLVRVKNSVQDDIEVKLEVVFLPYKAAMWDSLESIWEAANDDENCDAYVIPIPYYYRNPDGSFGKLHYEGEYFPENVPVTHFEQYDFGLQKPDMIYIHNPYDEYNRVTSVHPFFYSKNLKNFTEKLIYVPYYIAEEVSPESKELVEKKKSFCTASAVLQADRVIVQSENLKQIYVGILSEATGGNTHDFWNNKILALGAPQIDKILKSMQSTIQIPGTWKSILYKPDGTKKKTILYNTSIGALLEAKELMIEKMKTIFSLFESFSDEFAFIWRPHPLIPATIESMLPHLHAEYDVLKNTFRDKCWGIYDDTPDMNKAICISDAYYGDRSGVMELYRKTGKPIMIQTPNLLKSESKDKTDIIKEVCIENELCDIHMFLHLLMEDTFVYEADVEEPCGNRIWKYLKNE